MSLRYATATAAVSVVLGSVDGFFVFPSTRGAVAPTRVRPSSLPRLQSRRWERPCMSQSSSNKDRAGPTSRQNLIRVAGSAIASAASSLSIIDLLNPGAARAAAATAAADLSGVATESDRRGVEETTIRWKDTVTSGTPDAPRKTANLYASDGVLWGTVSEEVRDTPAEIYDYFDYFARLPKLRLSEYTPVSVRVYNDFATQAGTYTFAWQGADGETKEKRARFSFTLRRDLASPTQWTIVEHHSSSMPISPAELKHVRNSGTSVF